jgi:glucose/arabinose dehydrogenase
MSLRPGAAWIGMAAALVGLAAASSSSVFYDYRGEQPGRIHRITAADLPRPYLTPSAESGPEIVSRPRGAWPQAAEGFTVAEYATGLDNPRLIRTSPNGDLFVAESGPGRVRVLRGIGADGRAATVSVFAAGLEQPFGIAFYPPGPNPEWVYIANTGSVVRFHYRNGDLQARGSPETIEEMTEPRLLVINQEMA